MFKKKKCSPISTFGERKTADFKQKAARRKRLQGQAEKGKVLAVYVRLLRMSVFIKPTNQLIISTVIFAVSSGEIFTVTGYVPAVFMLD